MCRHFSKLVKYKLNMFLKLTKKKGFLTFEISYLQKILTFVMSFSCMSCASFLMLNIK